MLIGIDFDNTIVCYDGVFHRVAVAEGLIPPVVGQGKNDVRDYLRSVGREEDWTRLQGLVYGRRILEARPYEGVLEFFRKAKREGLVVKIISHKTRQPYLGELYDLHEAALGWLRHYGFFDLGGKVETPSACGGLYKENSRGEGDVYLELTKEAKLRRIAEAGCTHFVDDLPEFLAESGFPGDVQKILWNPAGGQVAGPWMAIRAWKDLWPILHTVGV
ncbi:MAG: hypothetical protein IT443_05760 [Phycisphaeraceae bacterium]|nr:hypothetical protein [Phycisphaeraceae bacterium]